MNKLLSILFLIACTHHLVFGQELNARVEVSAPKVQNVNSRIIMLLKQVIQDYLNGQSWSSGKLGAEERIDCSFVITISEYDGAKNYKADAQIMSFRPVFASNYYSPLLVFRDRSFNFSYTEGEQLDFSNTQNLNNLTALLGFYANVIIGMDKDSFRLYGGTPEYTSANSIVNYSQNSGQEGWNAMDAVDNRYWLINNLLDRRYDAYRNFLYNYHRNGLDALADNNTSHREEIFKMIIRLKEVDRFATGNVLTTSLFTSKVNEFVGLFSALPLNEKLKIYNQLVELDPVNTNKYEALKNN